METHFGRQARDMGFTPAQKAFVVGSLMSDGTLLQTTSGYCFRVHHGLPQRAYVDWKYLQRRQFVRTPPRTSGTGYYFRTVTHPYLTALRMEFYNGRRKIVPRGAVLDHITPLALAVWIMDDGARDGATIRLNVQSFSLAEAHDLARFLEYRYALRASVNIDKGKPRLRFATADAGRLITLVASYNIPQMRYKLPRIG